jgi:hypothetical protein
MTELGAETRDFLFDFVVDAPDKQLRTQEALDGKTVQVFGVASVVLALAGVSQAEFARTTIAALLALAIASYFTVAVASVAALWTRRFRVARHADVLWNEHWGASVPDLKHTLIAEAAESYAGNRKLLEQKSRFLKVALGAAGLEAICVASAVLISSVA